MLEWFVIGLSSVTGLSCQENGRCDMDDSASDVEGE